VFEGSSEHFLTRWRGHRQGQRHAAALQRRSGHPRTQGQGISDEDARNYAIVGCVELTTMGNNLGWSDAAMFNLVKALELALNDGVCTLTASDGRAYGHVKDFETYEDVLNALETQVNFFFERMIPLLRSGGAGARRTAAFAVPLLRDRRLHGARNRRYRGRRAL
jgi:hypothetical protein